MVINYRKSKEKAEELKAELHSLGLQAEIFQTDVAVFSEAEKLINFAIEKFGRIDILVNNAGITADNLIMRMSEDDFDRVLNVNLKGTWNCSKHAAKLAGNEPENHYISSVVGIVVTPAKAIMPLPRRESSA